MALKKSELYSSLWSSCDALRGGMDASQYKDYVLVLLFIKYVSDKYAGVPFAPITIPEGASFKDMVKFKGKPDIGDQINKKIIAPLANANQLSNMPDFNDATKLGSGKEMVERLTDLIAIFEDKRLDFSKNRADGDNLLGDAYEYLMRHFATESGKSKGQFYTPAEVSRVMAKVVGVGNAKSASQTIHDPTCGSGSLLLEAHDEAKSSTGLDLALYGQEMDNATSALARMNMILHDCPTAEIWQGNVLARPYFKEKNSGLKTFDFVVANPPFSFKAWSTGFNSTEDEFKRFESDIPPTKTGDLAFLLHVLPCLKSTGKAAVNLPHGVLFRGWAEATIRREIVKRGYIKSIIGLPANLFYGTGIPACIIVIDKEEAHTRRGIFMIDASAGYMKDGNKNRLRARDIHKIVDVFTKQVEIPKYARMVPFEEIEKNEFNLNLPRYIDSQEAEDIQDIKGHLRGGIPAADVEALQRYWDVCPQLREALFKYHRSGYLDLAVDKQAIKSTIFEHKEFVAFTSSMNALFADWRQRTAKTLRGLMAGCHPKEVIKDLSENLLAHYSEKPLLDEYNVYQHLMDYWAEPMQDDCYLIAADGWKAETYRIIEKDKKGKEKDKGWACELVPKSLLVARYFAKEQEAITKLEAELESIIAQLTEIEEEHGDEEGAFSALDKVNKVSSITRLKELNGLFKKDEDTKEEAEVLNAWLKLSNQETDLKRALKDAEVVLDAKAYAQYPKLTEAEIKTLVVEDKWLAELDARIHGEMDRISQALTQRVKELAERYNIPMPQIVSRVAEMVPSTYIVYFGLRENPFNVTADPRFFYSNPASQEMYANLLYGIGARKGVVVLTGAVGVGKTILLRWVMSNLGETAHCVFFSNPNWTFDELLSFTCEDLRLRVEGRTRLQKIQVLTAFLRARLKEGRTIVLLIDEAQKLEDEVLEDLYLLADLKTASGPLLPIVLAGQPELERKLAQPHLLHLTQHVVIQCRLACLKGQEVGPFIYHRLQRAGYERQDLFSPEALRCIIRYSKGIPRLITTICHEALFIAYRTAQKTVSDRIIEQVARNLELDETRTQGLWRRPFAGEGLQKRWAAKVRAEGGPFFLQGKDAVAGARSEQAAAPAAVPRPTVVHDMPAKPARAPLTARRPTLLFLSSSWMYLLSSAALLAGGVYWLGPFLWSVSPQELSPGLEAPAQPPSHPERKGTEAEFSLSVGNETWLSLREPSVETATGPAGPRAGGAGDEREPVVSHPSIVVKVAPEPEPPVPQFPRITQATPASEDILTVAEGQRLRFALEAERGDGSPLRYTWLLNGKEQTKGKQWTYRPKFTDGGEEPKEVKVVVTDRDNLTVERTWHVHVHDVNRSPRITMASPRPEAVAVASGGVQEFSITTSDPDSDDRLVSVWFLNGKEVARGERWQFHAPPSGTLQHETSYKVAVEVLDKEGREGQAARVVWKVTVAAPVLPPIITEAQPREETVSTQAGQSLDFSVVADLPGGAKTNLRYQWSMEGAPPQTTQAGSFRFVATTPATYHLMAVAVSPEGRESAPRRWAVEVRPAKGVPPPFFSLSEAEVRAWLEAQRQAWEAKNIDRLVELGAVFDQDAARARTILATYKSFSVALHDVEIRIEGSRATVTFSRADTINGQTVPHPDRKVFTLEKETNGGLTARLQKPPSPHAQSAP